MNGSGWKDVFFLSMCGNFIGSGNHFRDIRRFFTYLVSLRKCILANVISEGTARDCIIPVISFIPRVDIELV